MPDELETVTDDRAAIDPDFDEVDWFELPLEARLWEGDLYET